jgi:hypothetical protein
MFYHLSSWLITSSISSYHVIHILIESKVKSMDLLIKRSLKYQNIRFLFNLNTGIRIRSGYLKSRILWSRIGISLFNMITEQEYYQFVENWMR